MNLCPALVELKIKSRECTGRKAAAVSSPFFSSSCFLFLPDIMLFRTDTRLTE